MHGGGAPRIRRRTLEVAVVLVTAIASTVTVRAESAAAIVCGGSWSSVPSDAQVRQPRALVALSANDMWIVGTRGIDDGVVTTAAERWDGSRWSLVTTPNVGSKGENALSDVDGENGTDLFAVGYSTSGDAEGGGNFKTLVQRWNGSTWSIVQSPNAGGPKDSNALIGIDRLPSGRAWAVGYSRTGTIRSTLVERWNGSAWSIVASPNPGSSGNALLGVATVRDDDVWAVGWQLGSDGIRSLVMHWDGATWSEVVVPRQGTGDNVLTAVEAVNGADIWAVGYAVDGHRHRPLSLHYDGTTWSSVAPPATGPEPTMLRGLGAANSDDVWAVGATFRPGPNSYGAWSQHWDGETWSAVPNAASASPSRSELLTVEAVPGSAQVWTAGHIAVVETICPVPARTVGAASVPDSKVVEPAAFGEGGPAPLAATIESLSAAIEVDARDVASEAGLAETTKSRGAVIADITGDGRPDVFLGRHQKPARLYRNDGSGRFSEIQTGTFGATDRHGCDAADVDGNGALDLACAVGAARGTIAKRNELYMQDAGGSFSDRAWAAGVLEPYARGRSSTFVDADGSNGPDLFVANFPDRADGLPSPNRLFINDGTGVFRAAPEFGLESEVDSGAAAGSNPLAADIDGDGWEDILMDTAKGLRVYRNLEGSGFRDVAGSVGLGTENPVDLAPADLDGDGDLDIVSMKKGKLRILRNDGGSFRSVFSVAIQSGKAVATGDVNGDDRPDIYVMTGKTAGSANGPDLVFLNNGAGSSFASMGPIPSATTGGADSVWPIDHDGNGLTDFLVLNGRANAGGPVQLIAFYPST